MTLIGYVAPNKELAKIAQEVFEKHQLNVAVEIGAIEIGAKKAQKLTEKGVKVLISRGGTALSIRNEVEVPVVEVKITVQDIAKALVEASKLGNNIAIIGFNNLLEGLDAFDPLLNVNVRQIYIKDSDDAFRKIIKAKDEGAEVIIGGEIQCRFANKHNLKSVFLESGPQSIYLAYQEAKTLLDTLLNEKRKSEEIKLILEHSRDGYLAIDKKGKITLINRVAAEFMQCNANNVIGKQLKDVCPSLSNLENTLATGKESLYDIISLGTAKILFNRRPILLDNKIIGAVATLQDINMIQETESKVRRKIYTHGLYAKYTLEDIKGESDIINDTKRVAKKFARTDSTVLITGESGTGKELFAQGIHNASRRCKGPFVAVNCASLPESILESELFGYVEGAFTGARKKGKIGLFELAHKGTIFLDEISEIPLVLQGRLLRVVQERKVMRLGDDKVIPVDIRIIAATNKDIVDLVKQGKFREDLFFRINVLRLQLPALRERTKDIPILAQDFLYKYGSNLRFSSDALNALIHYQWPGNVRELRNLIERLSVMNSSSLIEHEIVTKLLQENKALINTDVNEKELTYEEIQSVLRSVGNNKSKAAKILGIHRSTLWRKLRKHNS